jgi:hypothetical protein
MGKIRKINALFILSGDLLRANIGSLDLGNAALLDGVFLAGAEQIGQ